MTSETLLLCYFSVVHSQGIADTFLLLFSQICSAEPFPKKYKNIIIICTCFGQFFVEDRMNLDNTSKRKSTPKPRNDAAQHTSFPPSVNVHVLWLFHVFCVILCSEHQEPGRKTHRILYTVSRHSEGIYLYLLLIQKGATMDIIVTKVTSENLCTTAWNQSMLSVIQDHVMSQ